MNRVHPSRRAATVAWFDQREHHRMLRCQHRFIHTQLVDVWAACCLLPAHSGRCRYIGWSGAVCAVGDGWVRL